MYVYLSNTINLKQSKIIWSLLLTLDTLPENIRICMLLVFKMVQPQYAWHNTSAMRLLKLREQMGEVPQQISGGAMIVIPCYSHFRFPGIMAPHHFRVANHHTDTWGLCKLNFRAFASRCPARAAPRHELDTYAPYREIWLQVRSIISHNYHHVYRRICIPHFRHPSSLYTPCYRIYRRRLLPSNLEPTL